MKALDNYFRISDRGSSTGREMIAGFSTFLAISYIFLVNPAILSETGLDRSAVFFATIVTSAVATIAMGLWARLPFVLAPGMEMNAFVAYYVVGALGMSWQEALGLVMWSSVIMIVVTATGLRTRVIDAIPSPMQPGIAFAIGTFLAVIALRISGVLHYKGTSLVGMGDFLSPMAIVFYFGLAVAFAADALKLPGVVVISVFGSSVLYYLLKMRPETSLLCDARANSFSAVGALSVKAVLNPRSIGVILVLFVLDFYGSVAKIIGLSLNTSIMRGGTVPRSKEALLIDGIGSLMGSALGTTSVTTYVESAVGIAQGGRTGLSAIVCGVLMLACFSLTPVLPYLPLVATTGALVYVGVKLSPTSTMFRSMTFVDRVVVVIMPLIVIWTFAIDRALLGGFVVYIVSDFWHHRAPNMVLCVSTALLLAGVMFQLFG